MIRTHRLLCRSRAVWVKRTIRVKSALATLMKNHAQDSYVTAAIMSSIGDAELQPLLGILFVDSSDLPLELWGRLFELAGAGKNQDAVSSAIQLASSFAFTTQAEHAKPEQFGPLVAVLSGLRRNPRKSDVLTKDAIDQLKNLAEDCMRVADNVKADTAARVRCIQIVGNIPQVRESVVKALDEYVSAVQDSQLQIAAIDALAERNQPDLADTLVARWPTFTPALCAHVLDVLVSRKQCVAALLAAMETHKISVGEIDAAHRSRLTEYPDAEMRQRRLPIFLRAHPKSARPLSRNISLSSKKATPSGANQSSRRIAPLATRSTTSAHRSVPISPPAKINRTQACCEILDPNRAVDQRFAEYVAVTTDGIVKNGILVEETSGAITLRGQQGQDTKLLRNEIESLASSGKSLMPEGFENQITPAEMSDLLTFLAAP